MTLPSSGPLAFTDIQTEFGGSNPIGLNEYYAGGSYVPAGTTGTYGAVPSSGQLSVQNFYGTSNYTPTYIEDVLSTYVYTGNGSTQTINNGIDLSGKGGMIWFKDRTVARPHAILDTLRGTSDFLQSNGSNAQINSGSLLSSFNSNGFSMLSDTIYNVMNDTNNRYVSWTFRKQPKFFDVVTYTGNGTTQNIAHSLGSAPGCILVKKTSGATDWMVYHRSLSSGNFLRLNTTGTPETGGSNVWGDNSSAVAPTSSVFTIGNEGNVNANGSTFVAYLFAHNAGGFGLTGSDNVISCGNFTCDGSGNATVNLGYEPQWILVKRTSSATDWHIYDTMRGWTADLEAVGTNQKALYPNLTSVEGSGYPYSVNATGFGITGVGAGNTFVYVAIRRGPMKAPASGSTSQFGVAYHPSTQRVDTGVLTDMMLFRTNQYSPGESWFTYDRLRGGPYRLFTNTNDTESTGYLPSYLNFDFSYETGVNNTGSGFGSNSYVGWGFKRAPSFLDIVDVPTATTTSVAIPHNLGVVPELIFAKSRTTNADWAVYSAALGQQKFLQLNTTGAPISRSNAWGALPMTSTNFYVDGTGIIGADGIFYLFATCAGVSKVGSYTGTGSTQTIDCGFSGGARFVIIKRTDSTSDWFTWDTTRGMVAGTDPAMELNLQTAEANANSVYTATTGFQLQASPAKDVNTNGATYIYLALA